MLLGSRNGRLYAAAENGTATAVQQGIYRVKSPEKHKKAVLSDGFMWRRRWDSNPRDVLPSTRFRVELVMTTSILLRSAPVSQVLNYYIILRAD